MIGIWGGGHFGGQVNGNRTRPWMIDEYITVDGYRCR